MTNPHSLSWSIRKSFTDYVLSVGGTLTVGEGASRTSTDFRFDLADERASGGAADDWRQFRGSVLYQAHAGMLQLELRDPWIAADRSIVSVHARSRSVDERFNLAARGEDGRYTLTEDAVAVFDGFYPAGAEMDTPKEV